MSRRCMTCGAPDANNKDRNWDDVTETQWAAMFHAPDLLAACKYLLENAESDGWSELMLSDARAAIAKAEGRGA